MSANQEESYPRGWGEPESIRALRAEIDTYHRMSDKALTLAREEHEKVHVEEGRAVEVALETIAMERELHAIAHKDQHYSHAREHELGNMAIDKSDQATEIRFASVNEFRAQLADQGKTFATLATSEATKREIDRRIEEVGKLVVDKYEDNRKRIENLEKGDVKQEGKSLGQGIIVAIIVSAIFLSASVLGALIAIVNFATGK